MKIGENDLPSLQIIIFFRYGLFHLEDKISLIPA